MSGPIVRTGTTPEFWKGWDRVFGGAESEASSKGKASKTAKPKKAAGKSGKAATTATQKKAAKKK